MKFINKLCSFFNNKPKIFLIDENINQLKKGVDTISSINVDVDGFTDYNKFLYSLQSKNIKYSYGAIHENGNKYPPQILKDFIKKIDPKIKLFIYKDEKQLEIFTQNINRMILT